MRSAFGLLALAQIAIGAAAIFARFALTGGGPIAISAARLAIAAIPVMIAAAVRRASVAYHRPTELRLALAGVTLALHFALWIASLRFAGVAVSTLLVCTTPIWTETFAFARTRRIRGDVIASIGLALIGVAIVIGVPERGDTPLGIGLALGGGICIAAYLLLVRAGDPRYGTLAIVGRTYPIAAAVLAAGAFALHDPLPATTNTVAWAGILAMALVSQTFGHTALNAAVRRLNPTLVATATLIEPAIAALLAALIFAERLAPATLAGTAVILIGIAIALRAEQRSAAQQKITPG